MTTATITELQTERARLKALDARRELDEATAQTRRADDLLRAALAVRAVGEMERYRKSQRRRHGVRWTDGLCGKWHQQRKE